MLYIVERGDSLWSISRRFNTTVEAIVNANVVCNPNLIFPGVPLIIPSPGLSLPRAGGHPYYVVLPGDSLWCLSRLFDIPVPQLAAANGIEDPDLIHPEQELLLVPRMNPRRIHQLWRITGGIPCDQLTPMAIHGIFYVGSFYWEALGTRAIPFLLDLLRHECPTVRFWAVMSLGRIARDGRVRRALRERRSDEPEIAELARLALRRMRLVAERGRRVHITTGRTRLHREPNLESPAETLRRGTEVTVLRWYIPSPTGEEGPRGDIQIYDRVRVADSGRVGYIPRVGFNEILMM